MLNSLNQRNEVRNLLIIISVVVIMLMGIAIRQANQVAQLNELNSQLIHEQQKVQESEKQLTVLKAQVNSQEIKLKKYKETNEELTNANEKLIKKNKILLSRKTELFSENKELIKKYKELVLP